MADRPCDLCDVRDDGPRHVIAMPAGTPGLIRHLSCCARDGCPVCSDTETKVA